MRNKKIFILHFEFYDFWFLIRRFTFGSSFFGLVYARNTMAEDKSENENPSARLVSTECAVQWIKRGCRLEISKPIFQIEGKLPGRKDFYYREICRAVVSFTVWSRLWMVNGSSSSSFACHFSAFDGRPTTPLSASRRVLWTRRVITFIIYLGKRV